MQRDPDTRKATVVGVTSHGPDCLVGPQYAYGYYTDVRQYLDVVATWLAGQEYVWSGDDASGGGGDGLGSSSSTFGGDDGLGSSSSTFGGGDGGSNRTALPPDWEPAAAVWQPVPGWPADWPTGGGGGGDATGGGFGLSSVGEMWCGLFPSMCSS